MNKPITVAADELNNQLIDLINNSGLPFFIIESILKDILQEVHGASKKQLEIDKKIFQKSLSKTASEEDGV